MGNGWSSTGKRTGHFDIPLFCTKNLINLKEVVAECCPSEKMLANCMKKAFSGNAWKWNLQHEMSIGCPTQVSMSALGHMCKVIWILYVFWLSRHSRIFLRVCGKQCYLHMAIDVPKDHFYWITSAIYFIFNTFYFPVHSMEVIIILFFSAFPASRVF